MLSVASKKVRSLRLGGLLLSTLALMFTTAQAGDNNVIDAVQPIPHSEMTIASGDGVVKAVLSCGTSRYAHAVLGDAIEAGCLTVEGSDGDIYTAMLPEHQVFEDLIPRIADVDGDGQNDVVVVRSDSDGGAALAIYTIKNEALEELAATPPIGRSFRWLAPVGIADFNGDKKTDVAYIQTPHIGGILKVWTFGDDGFEQIAEKKGFSNHSIGSSRVSTAKLVDYNNDGVMDMALPDQRRKNTVWVTLSPELQILDSKPYKVSYFD